VKKDTQSPFRRFFLRKGSLYPLLTIETGGEGRGETRRSGKKG
jgi:hypothetical protein